MDACGPYLYNSDMERGKNPIETFTLFGEDAELPDVVHCETIETRSVLHDWEIRPHRHARLHQVLVLDQGAGVAELETRRVVLGVGSLLNVPPGCVHSFKFEVNTTGWVVTLASELLDEVLHESEGLASVLARPDLAVASDAHRALVERIFGEYADRRFARAHMLRVLSAELLGEVARSLEGLDNSHMGGRDDPLRVRFERLVDEYYRDHLSVADYAEMLSVTPTHLSRVMRRATGRPASRVIEDRVLREARRQLFFTNLGVSQIAYLLGYEDPAYFSRVFSKATGLSPKAFRAQAGR